MFFSKYLFHIFKKITILSFCFLLFSSDVYAVNYLEEAENRKFLEIQTNTYENWPIGPSIGAQSAILIDANSGSILYAKNVHEKLYPASITKLLTTYIALNHCKPDDMITFSNEAVSSIRWWEDANMGVNPGTVLPLKDVLSGVLVGSANEAAYAIAEHISGNITSFSSLMNRTAKELGCLNSNFVNPNGIHNEEHYTTAYDMAMIAKAFFSNDTLSQLSGTLQYQVPVNETQPKEDILLTAKSQLLPGKPYSYDSLIGTKTGYTEAARQTLVSCAQKNGIKLICVVLKEENPYQYSDTVELFNYGFDNFEAIYLNDIDTPYSIENHFFSTSKDILGNSSSILSLDQKDYIVLPKTLTLDDLTSDVTYDKIDSSSICSINYYYQSNLLGRIDVKLTEDIIDTLDFSNKGNTSDFNQLNDHKNILYINISWIILFMVLISLFLICMLFLDSFIKEKKSPTKNKSKFSRRRFSRYRSRRF